MMVQSYPCVQAPRYSQPNRQKEFFSQRPISKDIFEYVFEYMHTDLHRCVPAVLEFRQV